MRIPFALQALIHTNIFIGLCALAMYYSACSANHINFDYHKALFIYSSTQLLYSLPFFYLKITGKLKNPLTYKQEWLKNNEHLFIIISAFHIPFAVYSFFELSWLNFLELIPAALIAFTYTVPIFKIKKKKIPLREIGIIKPFWITGIFIYLTWFWPLGSYPHWILLSHQLIFMLILCLLFDYRDLERDQSFNLKTWAVIFGYQKTKNISLVLCLFSLAGLLIQSVLGYEMILPLIIADIILFVFILFLKPKLNWNFYALGIDGLMIVQGLLYGLGV